MLLLLVLLVVGDGDGGGDDREGLLGLVGAGEEEEGEEGWTRGLATREGKAKNRRGMISTALEGGKKDD